MAKYDNNPKDFQSDDTMKTELARQEREKRLKEIKSRGSVVDVKKEQAQQKRNRILGTLAVVIIAIAALIFLLFEFGVLQRHLTAMRINGKNINISEYNYNYNTFFNQYNQAITQGQGVLNERASSKDLTGEDLTWGEFFHKLTVDSLMRDNVTYQKAVEAGYSLSEEDNANVDIMVDGLQKQVGTPLDFEMYLKAMYGKGMSVSEYRRIVEKQFLARNYSMDQPETFDISSEDVNKRYDENPDDYDTVTYHNFLLRSKTTDAEGKTLDEDKVKEAIEEAKKEADRITKEVETSEYEAIAIENANEKDKETYNFEGDQTLKTNVTKATITNPEISEWLFDKDRSSGDSTYVKAGNNFEIVHFVERQKDTRKTADIMVSNFSKLDSNGVPLTKEKVESIRKAAKALTSQFKSEEDVKAYDETEKSGDVPKADPSYKIEHLTGTAVQNIPAVVVNFALSDEAEAGQAYFVEDPNEIYVVTVLARHDEESWYKSCEELEQATAYQEVYNESFKLENNDVERVYPGFFFTNK